MEPAESSGTSTPPETEPVMDCRLVLTTLSGATLNVSLSIVKFDRFADLEDHDMDYLASVTDLKVFGCSIEFLHLATQTYLEDPIWDKLQQSMEYCIIFKDCSEVLPSQELLEGYPIHKVPLAVHVPMNPEGAVPEGAFAGFFLHEWRRCVCRLCTSHLSRVSRELPARLQPNRGRNKTKQPPQNPTQPKPTRKRKRSNL